MAYTDCGLIMRYISIAAITSSSMFMVMINENEKETSQFLPGGHLVTMLYTITLHCYISCKAWHVILMG